MSWFWVAARRAGIYTGGMNGRLLFAGLVALALGLGCGGKKKPESPEGNGPVKGGAAKEPPKPPAAAEWVRGKRIYFTTPRAKTLWLQFNQDGSVDVHHGKVGSFEATGKDVAVNVVDGKDSVIHFTKAGAEAGEKVEVTQDGVDVTLTVAKVEPAVFVKTIAKMKALAGVPLAEREKFFAGRRKGVYLFAPDEPASDVEVIYREDHTYTILYLHPEIDEDGKPTGEVQQDLTHGIWKVNEGKVYFLDLIWDANKKSPEAELEILECAVKERGPGKFVYVAPEEKDEDGEIIPESKYTEEPVKRFANESMSFYNEAKALKGYQLLEAYQRARLIADDE